MSVHRFSIVLLCVTLFTHACFSAFVITREETLSEENNIENEIRESLLAEEVNKENEDVAVKSESKSSESSEDSSSEEKYGVKSSSSSSVSSESFENDNPQEESESKPKQKRSVESDQESPNKLTESDSLTNSETESTSEGNEEATSTTPITDETEEQPSESILESTTTEITLTTETEISETSDKSSSAESNTELGTTTEPSEEGEHQNSEEREQDFTEMAMGRVDKLSEQIRKILRHYRKEGVVVVPGQSIFPEPMVMQDFEKSFAIGTVNFKNMSVYGLSNFTVEHINTDVDRMQVYLLLHMKQLMILGNYTLRTFWTRSSGPFNVTLLSVDSEGVAEVETTEEGHLEASDSEMDMSTKQMIVDFKGLGTMLQSMLNSMGDALFDSIKPQILDRVNLVIRKDVNEKLKDFSVKFVNKISPVDLAFSEGRRYVREHGYDPIKIPLHTFIVGGIVHINISEFNVNGLSRFNRVGNLSLSMDAGVIQCGVQVLSGKLTGDFKWSGEAFGISRYGKTNYTIDHLQVRALVNQSLNLTSKPQLEELDLHLGWVKVTMDSPMALNMMVEGIINAFPKLIKHMIIDALEKPLQGRIQMILNEVDVESFVDNNLPRLDNFGL